ncbi:Leucine aminopeptidase 1 [Ophidiomyces ophidiicola]|nr:Leucine aminopeptidase 1 [Ophidiomyces ophidiicola]KAI1963005.1 Leucine aminopeptidase 1 [Ophidiomyces ophidiicola]
MNALAVLVLCAAISPGTWARPTTAVEKFLVETAPGETQWITEAQKLKLIENGIGFFDITNEPTGTSSVTAQEIDVKFPTELKRRDEVNPLFSKLSMDNMRRDLQKFSSFRNRYYKSKTGTESAQWLFEQVQRAIKDSGIRDFSVKKFEHSWSQPSIIATIPGKSKNTIVVGAHQDSVNAKDHQGPAPGADDDGSGSVTILDSLRALLSSPKIRNGQAENTVEFHWYAGEEAGLLGSQDIFRAYKEMNKPVKAMLNQDMTGYTKGLEDARLPESFGLLTDNVNAALTEFTRLVIKGYTGITFVEGKCGYGCSDHASATKNGFPSAYVHETDRDHDNKKIHTPEDTIDKLNFNHMVKHGRLVVGWLYELAFAKF